MPVWPFVPSAEFSEALQWKTDIIPTYNLEQRVRLLEAPRQTFYFTHPLTHPEFEKANAIVSGAGTGSFSVPVWMERKTVTVSSGTGSIEVDTSAGDFRVNGQIIIWQDIDTYEVHTVQSIGGSPNTISLFATLANSYANAFVMPLRTCFAPAGLDIVRQVGPVVNVAIEFTCYDNVNLASSLLFSTYRGFPLINNPAVLGGLSLQENTMQPQTVFDNGLATPFFDASQSYLHKNLKTIFHTQTQAALWALREFLHNLYGKQQPFWLPTYYAGLTLTQDITSADTSLVINSSLFSGNIDSGYVFILQNDGTETALQFTSVAINSPDDGNEILTLSGAVGVNIAASDVQLLCLLILVRLDTDRIEMQHTSVTGTFIAAPCVRVPDL